MEFITSREVLPSLETEMVEPLWFNMWKLRLWPYKELIPGDILYWYESNKSKNILWKTRVTDVDRFSYDNKDEAKKRLNKRFGEFDDEQPYYIKAPHRGYCLAYKIKTIEKLNLPKPNDLKFPHNGWLHINFEVTDRWIEIEAVEEPTLDNIVSKNGIPIERLHQLNDIMAEVSNKRVKSIVSQTIRNDTQLIKALKEYHDFSCQFPGCNVKIPKMDGGYYIEVAHIEPFSKGGQSVLGNLLVLCPNHHKEFDYGDLNIIEQTTDCIRGKLNGKNFEINSIKTKTFN